jgi:hypothetical protein
MSVQKLKGSRVHVTREDLNDRSGQFLRGRGFRYKSVGTNQSGRCWGFMNAEKNDSGKRGNSPDLFRGVKAAHDGHRQIQNHNIRG